MKVKGLRAMMAEHAPEEVVELSKQHLLLALVKDGADESQVFTGSDLVEIGMQDGPSITAIMVWAEVLEGDE